MKQIPILTNFNVPTDLRNKFDDICHLDGKNRTQVLIELMSDYILTKGPAIAQKIRAIQEIDFSLNGQRYHKHKQTEDEPMSIWINDGRSDAYSF
jgi:hypothetical protein